MENVLVKIESKVAGRFKLQLNGEDVTSWFDNLVLDQGLNRMGTGVWFTHCHVGTSNVTPDFTQTSLQGFVAASNTVQASASGASGSSPYYKYTRRTYRFAAGTLNNVNLSEVGFGWATTPTSLFNRALIKDSNGNTTTITVLPTDILDVICELRAYQYSGADIVNPDINLGLSTHTFTTRSIGVTSSPVVAMGIDSPVTVNGNSSLILRDATLSPITNTIMTGTSLGDMNSSGQSITETAYSNNSMKRVVTLNIGLNNANHANGISGISPLWYGCEQKFQTLISPPIMKTSSRTLSLTFEYTWGRYVP